MAELQTPFDRLIAAAKSLNPAEIQPAITCVEDFEKVTVVQSEPFLAANRDALSAAREALQSKCSINLRYEGSYWAEHCENEESLRRLTRSFAVELGQAYAQGRLGKAARIGLDILELANILLRGGVITDFLVGNGCRGVGLDQLRRLRFQLDEEDRRMLIRELPRLEVDRDSFEFVVERDQKWEAALNLLTVPLDMSQLEMDPKECGLSLEDQRELLRCLQTLAEAPREVRHARYADVDRINTAMLRMLVIDLALRSYRAVNRSFPDELASLIPEYLGALPLDPFMETGFHYQRQFTDRFVLYSPGPGRVNHGATFGPLSLTHAGQFDLCLDTSDYESSCCELESYPRGIPGLVVRQRNVWNRWMNRH